MSKLKIIPIYLLLVGELFSDNVIITIGAVSNGENYVEENSKLKNGKPDLRSPVKVTVTRDGAEISGTSCTPTSSRDDKDTFKPASGVTPFSTVLITRDKDPDVVVSALGASAESHKMLPAKYKNKFAITGYYRPKEPSGTPKVNNAILYTSNPSKKYIITFANSADEGFLKEVTLEGDGYLENGTTFVRATNRTRPGTSNPIVIDATVAVDNQGPLGSTGTPLVANESCAVVFTVIPKSAGLSIEGRDGDWRAVDTVSSSQIGGIYHVDLFKGGDRAAANSIQSTDKEVTLNSY